MGEKLFRIPARPAPAESEARAHPRRVGEFYEVMTL